MIILCCFQHFHHSSRYPNWVYSTFWSFLESIWLQLDYHQFDEYPTTYLISSFKALKFRCQPLLLLTCLNLHIIDNLVEEDTRISVVDHQILGSYKCQAQLRPLEKKSEKELIENILTSSSDDPFIDISAFIFK